MKNRLVAVILMAFLFVVPNNLFAKNGDDGNEVDLQEDDSTVEDEGDSVQIEDDGISDIEIYVNVAARRLYLYNAGELIKYYDVATGMAIYPTPMGKYPIAFAISNPDWTPPNSPWAAGSHYEPPGPKSATGIAKLYLRSPGVHIHGTPKDNSIGTFASHGCIRMHNPDVVELLEYILDNAAHTKPGKYNEMSNEEYFAWVKSHPNTKVMAQMNETIYVQTYYKRVEILDGQLMIAKDGYHRGGDVMQTIEDELIAQGYNFKDLDWAFLEQELKNTKEDLVFDLGDLGAKRLRQYSQAER